MNNRERHLATWLFGKPDRVPLSPGGGRKSTLEAWHAQGLPVEVRDYNEYAYRLVGGTREWPSGGPGFPVNERMIPTFEEKVIEDRPTSRVVQDWKGNICEISDQYDVSYLRNAIDFVTRAWIKCPVESRADWEAMKLRYNVEDPRRYAQGWQAKLHAVRDRDRVMGMSFNGPFWQLREWLGFENLCMLLLDDPDFAREMIAFWEGFTSALLERILEHFTPDFLMINEDMAYKIKPMISPEMAHQFLAPSWVRWGKLAKAAGVPVYEVDSDGYVGDLIPVWIESGFGGNCPMEVAAGNDLPAFRRQYGTRMAYRGGVDKRAMAKGDKVLRAEIDRLAPAIRSGGIVPSCDHGIPADVSWPNFVEYCRLLAEVTGWA